MAAAPVLSSAGPEPAFLCALDHVHSDGEGGWIAECPICRDLLLITPEPTRWTFTCDGGCTHHELVDWLQTDPRRGEDVEAARRLWRATVLAPTLPVLEALLREEPVPVSALDPLWARRLGIR